MTEISERPMKHYTKLLPLLLLSLSMLQYCGGPEAAPTAAGKIVPGAIWPDNNGVHINAHGGGILFHDNTYYWFGEHKIEGRGGNRAQVGVHCYSSQNLYDWTDEGIALAVSDDPESDIVRGSVIERPKVIHNRSTGKFVMWFHLELTGQGYNAARTGVAVSDAATGPYTFLRSLRPNAGTWPLNFPEDQKTGPVSHEVLEQGTDEWHEANLNGMFVRRDFEGGQMSRDMVLFVDDDDKAYHVHASEENGTLHISQLSDDYLSFTDHMGTGFPRRPQRSPGRLQARRELLHDHFRLHRMDAEPGPLRHVGLDARRMEIPRRSQPGHPGPERNHLRIPEHLCDPGPRQARRPHPHGRPLAPPKPDRRPLHLAPHSMGRRKTHPEVDGRMVPRVLQITRLVPPLKIPAQRDEATRWLATMSQGAPFAPRGHGQPVTGLPSEESPGLVF